jgi:hypothetical protein
MSASATVAAGLLKGIVVNATNGEPLRRAAVFFPELELGVHTDSAGRFLLSDIPRGEYGLRAKLFGFASEDVRLRLNPDSGYAARIALTPEPVEICILYVSAPPGISVTVKDVATGRAPRGAVSLVVRDGPYRDSTLVEPDDVPDDRVIIGAAPSRPGTYDVKVAAHGYRPWRAMGVTVPPPGKCSFQTRDLKVWLLPNN